MSSIKQRLEDATQDIDDIKDKVHDLPDFVDTTDATANASTILNGYTAYANGIKLTGTYSGGGGGSNYVEISGTKFYVVTDLASIDDMSSGDYAYQFDSGNTYIYYYNGSNWIVPQQNYLNIWYEEE